MKTTILKYYCLIGFIWLGVPSPALCQFYGGDGDGKDNCGVVQMTLKGLQINDVPLFQGGDGDGHAKRFHATTLDGTSMAFLFAGGDGDGHDKEFFQGVMDGTDLTTIYLGGDGDGHSKDFFNGVIDGTNLVVLFSGGDGDGHDKDVFNGVIDGTALRALFSGGSGDGHDKFQFNGVLDGTMLSAIYGGGDGDGHDKDFFNGVIDGTDLASLYSGGVGDGFDKNMYSGILAVPLPVELIVFDAYPEHLHVIAFWITATEVDNDYFSVQRTNDFTKIENIGDVPSHGNQNGRQEYSFIDPDPHKGISYYRLQTTDFDGQIAFSDWVDVKFDLPEDFGSMTLFPNPTARETVYLQIEDFQPDWNIHVRITSMDGKVIFDQKNLDLTGNTDRFELDLGQGLAAGMYVVTVYGDYEKSILLMKSE